MNNIFLHAFNSPKMLEPLEPLEPVEPNIGS